MKLTLPSGARVRLEGAEPVREKTRFAKAFGAIVVGDRGPIDARDLALADFHVVRAVLTKLGHLEEEAIAIDCSNCGAVLEVRPCAGLELGPWRDGELDDPELDRTEAFGEPVEILPIAIGRVRSATTITLRPRTVREAMALFEEHTIDARLIEAMGIAKLGDVGDPEAIARALEGADDEAFASVTDAFLGAHYPPRLATDVFCATCKARNVVDAPYDREFERSTMAHAERDLPSLDAFVELAHRIAEPLIREIPGDPVELVVEAGVAAVDDGGEPLLGSYVPPPPADAPVPVTPARVTIYYRTFEAADREDPDFDWEEELSETIEHELEHHVYFLRGDDPMDEAEHAEIDREVVRVVGQREATRRALSGFGASVGEFFVRAWPLLLIGALAVALSIAEGRCN